MKSYHANSGAGLAGLMLKEHAEPKPGPRERLVRVRANSLNYRELSILAGTYRVKIGDRIAAAMFPRWIDGPIEWEYAPQIGGTLDGKSRIATTINKRCDADGQADVRVLRGGFSASNR
jgi:hypothetical protein